MPDFFLARAPTKFDVWWSRGLAVMAVLVLFAVAAVAIVVVVFETEGKSFERHCIDNPSYYGQISLSSNSRTVEWELQHYLAPTDVVTAIHAYGPLMPGLTDAPLLFPLCGLPSTTVVCDTSVANLLKGKIDQSMDNSLKVYIGDIRDFPRAYYLELITSMNTTGLRAPFGTNCGTRT